MWVDSYPNSESTLEFDSWERPSTCGLLWSVNSFCHPRHFTSVSVTLSTFKLSIHHGREQKLESISEEKLFTNTLKCSCAHMCTPEPVS